jgi:hypothetical protein
VLETCRTILRRLRCRNKQKTAALSASALHVARSFARIAGAIAAWCQAEVRPATPAEQALRRELADLRAARQDRVDRRRRRG